MTDRKNVAILISGRGSNMTALVEAARDPSYPARICGVLSNRADARGLDIAAAAGIATASIDHKAFPDRASFDRAIDVQLAEWNTELVALAGFMRIFDDGFVARWQGRMINIHPSLLPLFKGLNTHQRALDAGVCIHGCTSHFVNAGVDDGPIILQAAVPVLPDDDADSLAARVLTAEHRLYPEALRLAASGAVRLEGDKVVVRQASYDAEAYLGPVTRPD